MREVNMRSSVYLQYKILLNIWEKPRHQLGLVYSSADNPLKNLRADPAFSTTLEVRLQIQCLAPAPYTVPRYSLAGEKRPTSTAAFFYSVGAAKRHSRDGWRRMAPDAPYWMTWRWTMSHWVTVWRKAVCFWGCVHASRRPLEPWHPNWELLSIRVFRVPFSSNT